MNHLFRSGILLFVFSAFITACDKEKEGVPSYLHISKFTLTTKTATEGLNTSDITSAKVFVNGKEIGNFELPATFPVLVEGDAKVQVFPNIKENGASSSQKYFKPYDYFDTTVLLKKGELDTIKPKTVYRDSAVIYVLEDFELPGISFDKAGANNTDDSLVRLPSSSPGVDQPFGGSAYCGFVKMTSDTFATFQVNSSSTFTLPNLGADNYVEVDLKSNVSVQIGLLIYDGTFWVPVPVMVVFPTKDQWKKIYVNLQPETSELPSGTPIKVFFGFYKEDNDQEDKIVYIDNIKLLYVK